jgi:hypothetical protein
MLRPLYIEKILGTYCREGWVDFRAGLEGYGKEKINSPHRDSNPEPFTP